MVSSLMYTAFVLPGQPPNHPTQHPPHSEVDDGGRGCSRGRTDCEPCVEENEIPLCEPQFVKDCNECLMEYASASTERHAVCTKKSLMQVHQSTAVVAGRAMGKLFDLPGRQATPSSTGM